MSRRTGKDRPTSVKCRCGADIPVKTGGGPLPSTCQPCKDKRHVEARKVARHEAREQEQEQDVILHHDVSGNSLVETDYVELMRRERVELGCKFASFRAAVHALARDMNLGRVA